MSTLNTLETLLAQFELYEPEIGREFRFSPHLLMLGLGRSELTAWEASALNYFYGPANTVAFESFATALRLPPKVEVALLKSLTSNTGVWWQPTISSYERIERIRVTSREFELRYADKNGHHQIRASVPTLNDDQRQAVMDWLITSPDLPMRALARGAPLDKLALRRLSLIPTWADLEISVSSKTQTVLDLGVKFLCRALVIYPAHLLLWRGLGGESVIREFVEGRLRQRTRDFEAAAATLPADPAEFWATPTTPAIPAPTEVMPDPGLSAHLPPPRLWPKPEENQIFMDVLAKVYKNVPKKVVKLTQK